MKRISREIGPLLDDSSQYLRRMKPYGPHRDPSITCELRGAGFGQGLGGQRSQASLMFEELGRTRNACTHIRTVPRGIQNSSFERAHVCGSGAPGPCLLFSAQNGLLHREYRQNCKKTPAHQMHFFFDLVLSIISTYERYQSFFKYRQLKKMARKFE